ncbi:lysylphosphatidylglycerol synthase transmembrane domain-containing protein [Cytophaga aurantiaca]|uniref:lysylphosphatidylglycerol synthase transmembrane domain-containing protein n=1 Tax=Cytophaga aurantiaca TaxID=29530 RepID=UPI00038086C3|nr:lysylphosphatidylglycerol synthase transmembrane domain-containing protein [Cytophaga aurantiaca]
MKYLKNPYVKFSIKLLFTIVLLAIVFKTVPFNEVIHTIFHTNLIWLLIAIVFFILSKYFSSVRLNDFLKNAHTEVDTAYNMKLYLLGMFYNFFLPTGIGGDAYKAVKIHNDYSYPLKNIASTILLDRISGLAALVNIAVVFSFYYLSLVQSVMLLALVLVGNVLYHFLVRKFISNRLISLKTELLSLFVQLSQCICAYCILKALDIANNELIYIIVFLISSIASLFPLSIGGVGAREYTFMIASTYFHLHTEKAIAIGLLFYILSLVVSLFGSYFIFKPIYPIKTYV